MSNLTSICREILKVASDLTIAVPQLFRDSAVEIRHEDIGLSFFYYENADGNPIVAVLDIKRNRVNTRYRFRNEDEAYTYIDKTVKEAQVATKRKEEERQVRLDYKHDVKVGDIFYRSWGYDQTQCDYYKVVGLTGNKTAIIVHMSNESVGNDLVVPGNDVCATKTRARITQGGGGEPMIGVKNDKAFRWDGKPNYETPFGMGH